MKPYRTHPPRQVAKNVNLPHRRRRHPAKARGPHSHLDAKEPAFRAHREPTRPRHPTTGEGQIIAAILYHRDSHTRRLGPHSVFTVEWINRPAGRSGWYFNEHDFDYCRRDATFYHHNSGGGSRPYLSPLCSATRYLFDRERKAWRKSGLLDQSAIWWNPDIVNFIHGGHSGNRYLNPVCIARMGWRVLPLPALLCRRSGRRDPFTYTAGAYQSEMESTVYCQHCNDRLPSDSDTPCEHLEWRDGGNGYHYVGTEETAD